MGVSVVHVDAEFLPRDPLLALRRIISWFIYWLTASLDELPELFFDLGYALNKLPESMRDFAIRLLSLEDLDALFRIAFRLLLNFRPVVVIIDEFQDFLDIFRGEPIDVLGIIREMLTGGIMLIISGSALSTMRKISSDFKSRFFGQFEVLELRNFNVKEVWGLLENIWQLHVPEVAVRLILKKTDGFPYYIVVTAKKAWEYHCSLGDPPWRYIDLAYFHELVTVDGRINAHCRYIWNNYILRAKRRKYAKDILEILSIKGPLKPSEIASELSIDYDVAYKTISELENLGVVRRISDKYVPFSRTLALWLSYRRMSIEPSELGPENKELLEILRELERKIGKIYETIGTTFEIWVQELLSRIVGMTFIGDELGITKIGELKVPPIIRYNVKLNGEIDAILENSKKIAVSIKHGIITPKTLGKLSRKIKANIYWLIGKGFDTQIVNKALRSKNIILSDIETLNRIAKKIGYRKWKE